MHRFRSILIAGLAVALLTACVDAPVHTNDDYVVQPQDTLYSIAWRHDLDFRDLAKWNGIGPDFHISVGQKLNVTPKAAAAPAAPMSASTTAGPALKWLWPTDRSVAPRPAHSGGLLIEGRQGQEVRCAARGRVVYTGSGIRGYGQLVIIKHSDNLLSAYAYNREVSVHDGQEVNAGQSIASMGQGPHQAAVLYFEIRLNGRPVNPLPYLLGKK